jgi:flagellar biosynthesis protein FliQ
MGASVSVSTARAKGAARSRRSGTAAVSSNAAVAAKPAAVSAFYAAGPALSLGGLAQTKLKVGQAHDPYEREADGVAEQVTSGATIRRMPVTPLTPGALAPTARQDEEKQPATLQRQAEAEEERPAQARATEKEREPPAVQRQAEAEEEPKQATEEEQETPTVQRQAEAEAEPAPEPAAEKPEAPVSGSESPSTESAEGPEPTEAPVSGSESLSTESAAGPEPTEAPVSGSESPSAESAETPERTEETAPPEGRGQEEPAVQPMRAPEEEREAPTIQRQAEKPEEAAQEQPGEQMGEATSEQGQPAAEETAGPAEAATASEETEQPEKTTPAAGNEEEETSVQKMRAPEEEREAPTIQRRTEQRATAEQEQQPYSCVECREKAVRERPIQRQPEEEANAEPVQAKANPKAEYDPIKTDAVTAAIGGRPVGSPLPAAIQRSLEPTLGVNLSGVRVHTDSQAATAAAALKAKAFTHRHNIWLGRGQSPHDLRLMAHELTHVAQQGGARAAAPVPGPTPGRSLAAGPAVAAPVPNAAATPAQRQPAEEMVQREESLWDRARHLGGSVVTGIRTGARAVGRAVGGVIEGAANMSRDALLALIRRIAPGFTQLIEQGGVVNFLRALISGAFQSLFGGILGRIQGVAAFQNILGAFTRVAGLFRTIAAQLAANDCSGILQIAGQVGAFLSTTFEPVFRRIGQIARSVAGVFSSVLRVVGTPVVDFLRRLGGAVWTGIQSFARTVGDMLSSVRSAVGSAWTQVRSWFRLPEDTSADEGGGVWNWIKSQAHRVWNWAKGIVRPLLGPLRTVGQVLLVLSPVGPVIAAVAAWPYLRRAFGWLQQTWRNLNLIPRASAFLSNTVFPAITGALNSVGGALQRAGAWVVGAVQRGANALLSLLQAAGGQALLAPLAQAVSFVSTRFSQLATAVSTGVSSAVSGVVSLFHSAVRYLQPVWEVLKRLIAIAVNPFGITGLLMGSLWRALPECLKGPIIDFIISILIGLVRVMPSSPVLGLLWPFVRSALLGFLERLQSLQLERKVNASNKMATIISGGSVTFAFGYLKGLALGVWEAIVGPFLAIRDLFRLPELIRNFVSYIGQHFSDLIAEARQMLATLGERVESSVESLIEAARDLLQDPGRILALISTAIGAALSAVGGLGASLANQMIALFEGPDAMIGEMLGRVTGSYAVQAVLSYFTAGGASAASLISRIAGVLARVGGRVMSVLRSVVSYFPRILSFVRRIASLFARARSAVSEMLQRIVNFFRRIAERIVNFFRRIAERLRRFVRDWSRRRGADQRGDPRRRLRRASLILRPWIYLLLRHGVSRVGLESRLLLWQGVFRLSSLSLDRRGDHFQVIARVNPGAILGTGFTPNRILRLRTIRRVANLLLNHPNVRAESERMHQQWISSDEPIAIRPKIGLLALVRMFKIAARERISAPRLTQRYSFFQGGGFVIETFQSDQPVVNAFVSWVERLPLPSESLPSGSYTGILGRIGRMIPGGDIEVARAIPNIIRSTALRQYPGLLQEFTFLLFGREAVRNRAALVTSAMLTELVEERKITWRQAITQYHPMYGLEAQRGAGVLGQALQTREMRNVLQSYIEPQLPSVQRPFGLTERARAREIANRELNVIERWVMLRQPLFRSMGDFRKYVEKFMKRFHGLID